MIEPTILLSYIDAEISSPTFERNKCGIIVNDIIAEYFPLYRNDINKLKELLRIIYSDYRYDGENHTGKRLTKVGLAFLSFFFKFYDCKVQKQIPITTKHLIFLSKFCTRPFYIDSKKLIFFESELAMRYKLSSDNIEDFCDAFDDLQL